MADGKPVPNEYVNDLLAETMVKKAASKVIFIFIYSTNGIIIKHVRIQQSRRKQEESRSCKLC